MFDKLFDLWFGFHPTSQEQAEVFADIHKGMQDTQEVMALAITSDTPPQARQAWVNAVCRSYCEMIVQHAEDLVKRAATRAQLLPTTVPVSPGVLLGVSGYNFQDDVSRAFDHVRMGSMLAALGVQADPDQQARYIAMAKTEIEKARLCANSALALGAACLDMNTTSG